MSQSQKAKPSSAPEVVAPQRWALALGRHWVELREGPTPPVPIQEEWEHEAELEVHVNRNPVYNLGTGQWEEVGQRGPNAKRKVKQKFECLTYTGGTPIGVIEGRAFFSRVSRAKLALPLGLEAMEIPPKLWESIRKVAQLYENFSPPPHGGRQRRVT